MQANKQKYDALSSHDSLSTQIDCSKYKPFFDNFCCPINKRAIQGIVDTALKIDNDSNGESGIFQLNKYRGRSGKGSGKRLVAIIPSDTQKKLYKNGKKWLPRLYETLTIANSLDRYTICYQLILLHKFHMPKAFDDIC